MPSREKTHCHSSYFVFVLSRFASSYRYVVSYDEYIIKELEAFSPRAKPNLESLGFIRVLADLLMNKKISLVRFEHDQTDLYYFQDRCFFPSVWRSFLFDL